MKNDLSVDDEMKLVDIWAENYAKTMYQLCFGKHSIISNHSDLPLIDDLAVALRAMIAAAKEKKCGLKIADAAIARYDDYIRKQAEDKLGCYDFRCPEDGTINCRRCTGETCNFCGAGCWNNTPTNCEHSVTGRHAEMESEFLNLPLDHPAWKDDFAFSD